MNVLLLRRDTNEYRRRCSVPPRIVWLKTGIDLCLVPKIISKRFTDVFVIVQYILVKLQTFKRWIANWYEITWLSIFRVCFKRELQHTCSNSETFFPPKNRTYYDILLCNSVRLCFVRSIYLTLFGKSVTQKRMVRNWNANDKLFLSTIKFCCALKVLK